MQGRVSGVQWGREQMGDLPNMWRYWDGRLLAMRGRMPIQYWDHYMRPAAWRGGIAAGLLKFAARLRSFNKVLWLESSPPGLCSTTWTLGLLKIYSADFLGHFKENNKEGNGGYVEDYKLWVVWLEGTFFLRDAFLNYFGYLEILLFFLFFFLYLYYFSQSFSFVRFALPLLQAAHS